MEQITESSDVLLDSDWDHDLTTALSNTRSLSEEKEYQVESTRIQESNQVQSLFTSIDSRAQLQFHPQELDLGTKDITSTTITRKHLREYPQNTEFSSIQPIDPLVAETASGDEVMFYFAHIQTKYIVQIQLKGETGDRQTVYTQYSREWKAERLQRLLSPKVQLNISNDTIVLENSPPDSDSETLLVSLRTKITEYPSTARTVLGLIVLTASIAGMLLSRSSIMTQVSLLVGIVTIFILVASDKFELDFSSSENTVADPFDEAVQLEHNPVEVRTVEPTTDVTVETRVTENKLELSLANNNQDITWSYSLTDQGIFTDEDIVNFYTELGFDKSEKQTFRAYLSTINYDTKISLKSTNTNNPVYLYANDPRST